MKHTHISIENDKIIYHYSFADLRNFITLGKAHGDVGMILMSFENGVKKYRGFGTIENPSKWICTLSFMHHPLFDDNKLPAFDHEKYPSE